MDVSTAILKYGLFLKGTEQIVSLLPFPNDREWLIAHKKDVVAELMQRQKALVPLDQVITKWWLHWQMILSPSLKGKPTATQHWAIIQNNPEALEYQLLQTSANATTIIAAGGYTSKDNEIVWPISAVQAIAILDDCNKAALAAGEVNKNEFDKGLTVAVREYIAKWDDLPFTISYDGQVPNGYILTARNKFF